LTLDGSEDSKINIEGPPDYKPKFVSVLNDEDENQEDVETVAEPEPDSDVTDDENIEIENF
jgi:hypothetical protein